MYLRYKHLNRTAPDFAVDSLGEPRVVPRTPVRELLPQHTLHSHTRPQLAIR